MEELKTFNDFNLAMQELTKNGKVITSRVNGINTEYYRVKITVGGVGYFEDGQDVMIATIRLRNQFN